MRGHFRFWVWQLLVTVMIARVDAQAEFRGFWVDGFNEGFHTPEEVDTLLRRVREANMNALIVQMRKRGDAHYFSPFEPFAANQQPGFDALSYLIEKAHSMQPPIEVHVWVNCHPIWPGSGWPPDPKHVLNRFPEIQTESLQGGRITEVGYGMDWGHPLANAFFTRVVLDIVRRYDIDGLHFDYIRYTGEQWGYNPVSVERFNRRYGRTGIPAPTDPLWKQWRRDQVTAIVRKVYANAVAIKPQIKISAALITWGDGPRDTDDWVNRSAYSRVFQDWRGWLEEGILDMAIPMIYYHQANPERARFYQNWVNFLKDHQYGRHGVAGIGNYLNSHADTLQQIEIARAPSPKGNRLMGVNFFSYAATSGNGTENGSQRYEEDFYRMLGTRAFPEWVPTPPMDWKRFPTRGHLMGTVLHARDLSWVDGATVELYRHGMRLRQMQTDGTGFYAFVHLEPGVYSLTVRAEGSPAAHTQTVVITPGLTTALHWLLGETDAQRLHRLESLHGLPDGTRVLLAPKRVLRNCESRDQPLLIGELLGERAIEVHLREWTLPWLEGDRVAVLGTLATQPDGSRILTDAIVQWLGTL
ncbi:MAG: family 10 glycosylhydrolase [Armatimonadota bacterium]